MVRRRSLKLCGTGVEICARNDWVFVLVIVDKAQLGGVLVRVSSNWEPQWVELGKTGLSYACTMYGSEGNVAIAVDDSRRSRWLDVRSASKSECSLLDVRSVSSVVACATAGDSTVGALLGDGTLRIEEKSTGEVHWIRGSAFAATALASTCAGEFCLGGGDGSVRRAVDGARYGRRLDCGIKSGVSALSALTEGRLLVAHNAGELVAWDVRAGAPFASWHIRAGDISCLVKGAALCGHRAVRLRIRWDDDTQLDWEDIDEPAYGLAVVGEKLIFTFKDDEVSAVSEWAAVNDETSREDAERREFTRVLACFESNDTDLKIAKRRLQELFDRLTATSTVWSPAAVVGRRVAVARFATADAARTALETVMSALAGARDEAARDTAVYAAEVWHKLNVFEEIGLAAGHNDWTRAWARFRDGEALEVARQLASAGEIDALQLLWRHLLSMRCVMGGAVTRAAFSERVVAACVEHANYVVAPELARWLCRDVAPALRGSACYSRLAAWATRTARRLAIDEARTDEALEIADTVAAALEAPLSIAAAAAGSIADAWLADGATACNDEDPLAPLRSLTRRLRRVVELRDGARFATTLASYEATADKASIAVALLDRVREPTLIAREIEHHVRPVCESHRIDADDLLLEYVRNIDSADRGAAVARELRGSRRRVRAASALVAECSRPPYPNSILKLATDCEAEWKALADTDDEASDLLDALRVARLTHVAHKYACDDFDPGEPARAAKLAAVVARFAASGIDDDVRAAALDDLDVLARAYPATLSIRANVVAVVSRLAGIDNVRRSPRELAEIADAVVSNRLPRGAERQSTRREIVVACRRALDVDIATDCRDKLQIHPRFSTAAIGAAVGRSLVQDNARADHDDENDRHPRKQSTLLFGRRSDARAVDELRRLAALYEEFELFEATPAMARRDKTRLAFLERAAEPLVTAVVRGDNSVRPRLERLAELLAAPASWTAAALTAAACDGRFAEEIYEGESSTAASRATALRLVSKRLRDRAVHEKAVLHPAARWRKAALRSLAMAVAIEPRAASTLVDLDMIEALRFVDALASRCVGAASERGATKNDGLLLSGAKIEPQITAALLEGWSSSVSSGLVATLAESEAWRLAARALRLGGGELEEQRRAYGAQLRCWLLSYVVERDDREAALDAEILCGLAVATHRKSAVDAYREALGGADIDRIGDLASLGVGVAASLDEPRLEATCASLAVDATWWRLLGDRRIPFDHSRLRVRGRKPDDDCTSHAKTLLAPLLDFRGAKTRLPASDLNVAVKFCQRYGIDIAVAGEATAVRFLARGVEPADDSTIYRALDLVADTSRELAVLRAAITTAPPTAYDRIDSTISLLLDKTPRQIPNKVSNASPFAAPSRSTLEQWRRLVRWLKRARQDPAAVIGESAARHFEAAGMLSFHDLVTRPLETLDPFLTEESAPLLARVARATGVDPAALWCRLAKTEMSRGHNDTAWRCLDQAAHSSLDLAATAAAAAASHSVLAADRAYTLAVTWAQADKSAKARETAHQLSLRRMRAIREAVARAFIPSNTPSVDDIHDACTLLHRLYSAAAESAAAAALEGPKSASRAKLWLAARRAHRAARVLARFEGDENLAESARRELARAWLFDDDDDGETAVDAVHGAAPSIFLPTALERREMGLASRAVKVAFVLSAREIEQSDRDEEVDIDTFPDDLKALEARQLEDDIPQRNEHTAALTAIELLVELAASSGGPGDEAADQSSRFEAGRRERLTARARLRALRAAAVLAPTQARLQAAWERVVSDDEDAPVTLVALSRRLRVVAALSEMRLPHARVVAARGAACGIGVRAVVRSLLHDHSQQHAAALLPLLAALLLEAYDDEASDEIDRLPLDDDVDLWQSLLEAFVAHKQWRSLLTVLRRLSARPWIHTWCIDSHASSASYLPFRRADNLRHVWLAALRQPADEILEINDRTHKPRCRPRLDLFKEVGDAGHFGRTTQL